MPGEQSPWAKISASKRKKIREHVFARAGDACEIRGPMCNGRAEEVDHIVPIAEAPERILDPSNWRAACKPCNGGRASTTTAGPSRDW